MSWQPAEATRVPLERYLDEEAGEPALREAAASLSAQPDLDIAALFDWLQHHPAEATRRARAQVVLRAALGLPLVPGPVCRSPAR